MKGECAWVLLLDGYSCSGLVCLKTRVSRVVHVVGCIYSCSPWYCTSLMMAARCVLEEPSVLFELAHSYFDFQLQVITSTLT